MKDVSPGVTFTYHPVMNNSSLSDRIRKVLAAHGRLPTPVASLPEDADLNKAGMTSHATVNVMLALEVEFDIEFPDQMLTRNVFNSVASIRSALEELTTA